MKCLLRCSGASAFVLIVALSSLSGPQATIYPPAWIPDLGDGRYRNPVLYADYSDPDVIRVGEDYFMTSSSFSNFPGLPILQSKDLVNWIIIGHAVQSYPYEEYAVPRHGTAIWAPSIRFHNGEFYIYFGDPDRGVFMTKTKDPAGSWAPLRLVRKVTGWIDPCPLWDDDGNAYLVHAWANSRVGVKSILAVNRMNPEGTEILDDGIVVAAVKRCRWPVGLRPRLFPALCYEDGSWIPDFPTALPAGGQRKSGGDCRI
jgi:hypothetical protein